VHCPTLRQILLWEIERNIHPRLPKLREKSAASGLLWICRQLQYQNTIFQNILQVPEVFPTAKLAVTAAYNATYDKYHGFLVKQIFLSSFDAAPSAEIILSHMNPSNLDNDTDTVEPYAHDSTVGTMDTRMKADLAVTGIRLADYTTATTPRNPLEFVANHFVCEWMKLERFLSQCNGMHAESSPTRNGLIVPSKGRSVIDLTNGTGGGAIFEAVVPEDNVPCTTPKSTFATNATEEITSFSATLQPILQELQVFLDDWNMNDPSKC
jgi:Glycolipid transfer protein (GLTP)